MDQDMDFTLSGAARAPPLASTSSLHRAREPFHVQAIPPHAQQNASPAYVTHLLSLSTSYGTPTLLAIADDSTLTLIDKTSGVVAESHRAFKDARITQAKPLSTAAGNFVASVSDGTVACWDTRSGLAKPVWTLQGLSKAPYLCVEPSPSDANVVVAGTEQYGHGDSDIDIWDVRSVVAPKSKYNEVHSDDVTVLQYHPDAANHAGILLSGSTDGLVSAIDTTIAEEDDAVISVGNTGNSVARAGWLSSSSSSLHTTAAAMDTTVDGDQEEADLHQVETEARRRGLGKVWAVGDMQTLSLFDADKFDPILPSTDVRSSSSLRPPWSTDYVIDGFTALASFPNPPPSSQEHLTLFVGKSEGAFATITIPTTTPELTSSWGLRALFPEQGDGTLYGHADIVRSVEWDAATNTLYTGGEDGNLCFWNFDPAANQVATSGSIALSSLPPSASGAAYNGSADSPGSSRSGSRNATPGRSQRYTPYK